MFRQSRTVEVKSKTLSIFVQTDKAMYKPQQQGNLCIHSQLANSLKRTNRTTGVIDHCTLFKTLQNGRFKVVLTTNYYLYSEIKSKILPNMQCEACMVVT